MVIAIGRSNLGGVGCLHRVRRQPRYCTEDRLIVRRVKRLNPKATAQGQHELFATYRYHAVFTDSPFQLTQSRIRPSWARCDRAGLRRPDRRTAGHLPSAAFNANAGWLQLAVTAHAVTRALGSLALARHALARGATIRTQLLHIAARPARSKRDQITWHLPEAWLW